MEPEKVNKIDNFKNLIEGIIKITIFDLQCLTMFNDNV